MLQNVLERCSQLEGVIRTTENGKTRDTHWVLKTCVLLRSYWPLQGRGPHQHTQLFSKPLKIYMLIFNSNNRYLPEKNILEKSISRGKGLKKAGTYLQGYLQDHSLPALCGTYALNKLPSSSLPRSRPSSTSSSPFHLSIIYFSSFLPGKGSI